MQVEDFFNLFLLELEENPNLRQYYRFINKDSFFQFRKAYFCQRLQYVIDHINDKSLRVWDCGCGYGTTGIFLALNGFNVYGNTLEYYFEEISNRKKFWNRYGNTELFDVRYENLFDNPPSSSAFDIIIAQDTLHHIEPFNKAVDIFGEALNNKGKLIICEVNGNNIFERTKFFLKRGNKRITEIYDDKFQKKIPFGNENIRSLKRWKDIFSGYDFKIIDGETQYIRLYPPFFYNDNNYDKLVVSEQKLTKKSSLLREYFFFGINFIAEKSGQ